MLGRSESPSSQIESNSMQTVFVSRTRLLQNDYSKRLRSFDVKHDPLKSSTSEHAA
jgi:hypothetical protein